MIDSDYALFHAPARILIVDDHPHAAAVLAQALGEFTMPVEILTACSGAEALERAGGRPVAVLISDFMMPGMNGLELIERLNALPGSEPAHTVLVTGYDSPGLAATARRLRVNDYLVKPFGPEKIREIVNQVLGNLNKPQPLFAKLPAPAHFKILIADDLPDNVSLLITRLEAEGYTCSTAGDGGEALQRVRAERPDLVLLDVNMPEMNGFEVVAAMRSDPDLAHIPVIILTAARSTPRDIREGLSLGADDYVTKPFDWRELAARVRAKLRVKYAEDTLRRRNRELSLLPAIGRDLSARLDVDELTGTILRRAVEALGATNGHLVIFYPDGGSVHKLHADCDFAPWTWEEAQKQIVHSGLVEQVISTGEGVIIHDARGDPRWLALAPQGAPIRSALAVPLLGQRGVIGVLTLYQEERDHFTAEHLTLLQAIASQSAIAIENAQLYAAEHKRVDDLVALNQLTREINLVTSSDELFDRIPHLINEMLGYPVVSLWLTDAGPRAPSLRQLAAVEEDGLELEALSLAPQQVVATGQPVMLAGSPEAETQGGAGHASQSAVAVPLFWSSRASGVLALHRFCTPAFQEHDRVLLEMLAAQIAAALERIRLFETVEQEKQRLTAVLNSAAEAVVVLDAAGRVRLLNPAGRQLFREGETRVGEALPTEGGYHDWLRLLERARVCGRAEQGEVTWPDERVFSALITPIEDGGQVAVLHDITRFKDLDRVKNEFIATASHDLKNPITSFLNYSVLIAKAGPLTANQAMYVDRMRKAARQMSELVQNLLALAQGDLGLQAKPEPCAVADLLAGVVSEFQIAAEDKQQTLTLAPVEASLRIIGDLPQLRQALRNLIGNALKYTPGGGEIRVLARAETKAVRITVHDTGIGIPPEALPFVFDKFYRVWTGETQEIEGHGLGLAIVKSIVERHGGQVEVKSLVGQGSCFSFTLPLAVQSRVTAPLRESCRVE